MSLPLPWYSCIIFTVPTVFPWNFPRTRGNYRGYRGVTAFPITVSSSNLKYKYANTGKFLAWSGPCYAAASPSPTLAVGVIEPGAPACPPISRRRTAWISLDAAGGSFFFFVVVEQPRDDVRHQNEKQEESTCDEQTREDVAEHTNSGRLLFARTRRVSSRSQTVFRHSLSCHRLHRVARKS